jgi:hypothetical protein
MVLQLLRLASLSKTLRSQLSYGPLAARTIERNFMVCVAARIVML